MAFALWYVPHNEKVSKDYPSREQVVVDAFERDLVIRMRGRNFLHDRYEIRETIAPELLAP